MKGRPLESLKSPKGWLYAAESRDVERDLATGFRDDWLWPKVYAHLRRGVFHATSVCGWSGIKSVGSILPNRGERAPTFEMSRRCHGWSIGAVCLFDLESACVELIAHRWGTVRRVVLGTARSAVRHADSGDRVADDVPVATSDSSAPDPSVLIQFADRAQLPGPWEYWRRSQSLERIPYIECWHLGPMPLCAATAVHVVRWDAHESERWRSYEIENALALELA
jgi:hypothetical protein